MNLHDEINKLNPLQRQSHDYGIKPGYLLTLAVPGSGKTKTVTCIAGSIVAKGYAKPNEVFVCTFTRKAAQEMRKRLFSLIGEASKNFNIYTFHSFCFNKLKEYGPVYSDIKYKKFEMLDELNQSFTFHKIFNDSLKYLFNIKKISENTFTKLAGEHDSFLNEINIKKTEGKTLVDFLKKCNLTAFEYSKANILAFIWAKYETYKEEKNLMDFNDILIEFNALLNDNIPFRNKIKESCKYIIVDEFQDTNDIQMSIIVNLHDEHLAVFGDPNQSIYKFRKANIHLINNFAEIFNAKVVNMNINYRSHSIITDAATELIRNNSNLSDNIENFFSIPDKHICSIKTFTSHVEEAKYIADFIYNNKKELGSIGIIYRNNIIGEEIGLQLKKIGIFYDRKEEFDIFRRIEIKLLFNILSVYCGNDNALPDIIKEEKGVGKKTIDKFLEEKEKCNKSYLETALSSENKKIKNFAEKINKFILNDEINDILKMKEFLFEEFNLNKLESKRIKNLNYMFSILSEFKNIKEINIEKLLEMKEKNVRLITCHASKGLEFDTVFIPAFSQEIIPSIQSINENDIEEERRLAYVAITRAKTNLIISHAQVRFENEETKTYEKSQFLNEFNTTHFGIDNSRQIGPAKTRANIVKEIGKILACI